MSPWEIPGANAPVLPAGVSLFRLRDSLSGRHIVQVLILAIANYRRRAAD